MSTRGKPATKTRSSTTTTLACTSRPSGPRRSRTQCSRSRSRCSCSIYDPPQLAPGQSLASALLDDYRRYIALVSSFAIIGLVWIHHHRLFRFIERADHTLVNLNLLLMLAVLVVPYPTTLLAAFPDQRAAAVIYTSVVALIALLFNVLWHYLRHRPWLLRSGLDPTVLKTIDLQYRFGFAMYALNVAVSFMSIRASIVGNILLAIYFALPLHVIKRRASQLLHEADAHS